MCISSTGLYGSATSMNSDLFNDVETLKKQVTTLSTYLETEHREDISDNLSKINDTAPRRAVLAAHFSPRWCRWFLSALSPCADSTKDASGRRCADVFTANGCGQQGAGAARALLPHRAVRALASRALLPHRTVRALVPPLRFGRRHPAASRSAGPDPHPGGRRDKMIPRARFSPLLGHPAKLGCAVLPMCALAVAKACGGEKEEWPWDESDT